MLDLSHCLWQWAVRYFAEQEFIIFIAQSFSKNMGLYGERCGCASVLVPTQSIAQAVKSQIELIVRPMYSVRGIVSCISPLPKKLL